MYDGILHHEDVSDPALPAVLVVHGDRSTAAAYAEWLSTGYETHVASPWTPIDPPVSIDVVILDWGLDPSVRERVLDPDPDALDDAAVLAVDEGVPASDPIDAGADDYLLSPLGEGELRAAVERVFLQCAYRRWVDEYVEATDDVEGEAVPPELAASIEESHEAMEMTLSELVEQVPYPTLFRALLERRDD